MIPAPSCFSAPPPEVIVFSPAETPNLIEHRWFMQILTHRICEHVTWFCFPPLAGVFCSATRDNQNSRSMTEVILCSLHFEQSFGSWFQSVSLLMMFILITCLGGIYYKITLPFVISILCRGIVRLCKYSHSSSNIQLICLVKSIWTHGFLFYSIGYHYLFWCSDWPRFG